MLATLLPELRSRLNFVFDDFADCDLAGLVRAGVAAATLERRRSQAVASGAGGGDPAPSTPPPPTSVVVYINNLAFPPGVSGRHGRQLVASAAELGGGVGVTIVSAVPLAALEGGGGGGGAIGGGGGCGGGGGTGAAPVPLTVAMSFNPAHEARVYQAAA
jgi:hypothetical protein